MLHDARQDQNAQASGAERRQFGRIRQDELYCSLGQVEDLSAGGMRVQCRRVPRGQVSIKLRSRSGVEIVVTGQAVWRRRLGIGRHMIGIRFSGHTQDVMQKLTRIATEHRLNRTMRMNDNHLIG